MRTPSAVISRHAVISIGRSTRVITSARLPVVGQRIGKLLQEIRFTLCTKMILAVRGSTVFEVAFQRGAGHLGDRAGEFDPVGPPPTSRQTSCIVCCRRDRGSVRPTRRHQHTAADFSRLRDRFQKPRRELLPSSVASNRGRTTRDDK